MKINAFASQFLLFVIFLLTACKAKQRPSLEELVNRFSPMECRAILLREQRFALANEIRFTQDTLSRAAAQTDTMRLRAKLQQLNIEKEHTTRQSLLLADSIKASLDSLMTQYLIAPKDKEQFNQLLNTKLENMHCKGTAE